MEGCRRATTLANHLPLDDCRKPKQRPSSLFPEQINPGVEKPLPAHGDTTQPDGPIATGVIWETS